MLHDQLRLALMVAITTRDFPKGRAGDPPPTHPVDLPPSPGHSLLLTRGTSHHPPVKGPISRLSLHGRTKAISLSEVSIMLIRT